MQEVSPSAIIFPAPTQGIRAVSQTVDEIIERFKKTKHLKLKPRTQKDYLRHYATISRDFGDRQAKDISLRELQDWMKVDTGPIQRNRALAVVSSLFGAAVEWEWLGYNVCKEVERNEAAPRQRVVSDKEFQRMRRLAGNRLSLAMDLSLLTGLKQGKIIQLTRQQIYREDKVIRAAGREIDITPEVDAVLAKCGELPTKEKSNYVLPTRFGKPYTGEGFRAMWSRRMKDYKRAGNVPFTFQDIAKTWAYREKQKLATKSVSELDKVFEGYPYFDEALRREATEMAPYYAVFYCLEQSIRKLVTETLQATEGKNWWESDKIQESIRTEVKALMVKEPDMAVRQRSPNEIDYTTFGQLRSIILQNWSLFEDVFTRKEGIAKLLDALRLQRGPIAHCTRFDPGERERLRLQVFDWFVTLRKRSQVGRGQ